jgi:DEAD/DEAH box helicase domain-containing protein
VVLAQPVLPRGRIVDVVEVKREEDGGERVDRIVGTLDEDGVERDVRIKEEPAD